MAKKRWYVVVKSPTTCGLSMGTIVLALAVVTLCGVSLSPASQLQSLARQMAVSSSSSISDNSSSSSGNSSSSSPSKQKAHATTGAKLFKVGSQKGSCSKTIQGTAAYACEPRISKSNWYMNGLPHATCLDVFDITQSGNSLTVKRVDSRGLDCHGWHMQLQFYCKPAAPKIPIPGHWDNFVAAQDQFMSQAGNKARFRSLDLAFQGSLMDSACRKAIVDLGAILRGNPCSESEQLESALLFGKAAAGKTETDEFKLFCASACMKRVVAAGRKTVLKSCDFQKEGTHLARLLHECPKDTPSAASSASSAGELEKTGPQWHSPVPTLPQQTSETIPVVTGVPYTPDAPVTGVPVMKMEVADKTSLAQQQKATEIWKKSEQRFESMQKERHTVKRI